MDQGKYISDNALGKRSTECQMRDGFDIATSKWVPQSRVRSSRSHVSVRKSPFFHMKHDCMSEEGRKNIKAEAVLADSRTISQRGK